MLATNLPSHKLPDLEQPYLQFQNATTSLIEVEQISLFPKFYAYSIKACLFPIRNVQSTLIALYFRHIHPLFPIVDKNRFNKLHCQFQGQEEHMDPSDFIIYHAIMIVGFSVWDRASTLNLILTL
jgi:hypothetical protein